MSKRTSLREQIYADLKREWGKFLDVLRAKERDMEEGVDEQMEEVVSYLEMAKESIDEHIEEIEEGEDPVPLDDGSGDVANAEELRDEVNQILKDANDLRQKWLDDYEGKKDELDDEIQRFVDKYEWSSSIRGRFSYAQSQLFGSTSSYASYQEAAEDVQRFDALFKKTFEKIGESSWPTIMEAITSTNQEILEYAQENKFQFINEDRAFWPEERSEYRPLEMYSRYEKDTRWMTMIEEHNPYLGYLADELHRIEVWGTILANTLQTTGPIYSFFAWCAYWIPNFKELLPLYYMEKFPLQIDGNFPGSTEEYVAIGLPTHWFGNDWYRMNVYVHKNEIRPDWQRCAGPFALYFLIQLKEPLSQMPGGEELFKSLFEGFSDVLNEEDNFLYHPIDPDQDTDVDPSEFSPRFPFPLEDGVPTLSLLEVDPEIIASRWAHGVALLMRWQGNLTRITRPEEILEIRYFERKDHLIIHTDIEDLFKTLGLTRNFVDLAKAKLIEELEKTGPFFEPAIETLMKAWEGVSHKIILDSLNQALLFARGKKWQEMESSLSNAIAEFHFYEERTDTVQEIFGAMYLKKPEYRVISLDEWFSSFNIAPPENYDAINRWTPDTPISTSKGFDATRFALRISHHFQYMIQRREKEMALENWASGSDEDLIS